MTIFRKDIDQKILCLDTDDLLKLLENLVFDIIILKGEDGNSSDLKRREILEYMEELK